MPRRVCTPVWERIRYLGVMLYDADQIHERSGVGTRADQLIDQAAGR